MNTYCNNVHYYVALVNILIWKEQEHYSGVKFRDGTWRKYSFMAEALQYFLNGTRGLSSRLTGLEQECLL